MARYWVGGTASWDATAGTKWATTSGGTGGSAVPTSADDVFFDAASGAVTVTVAATVSCNNLDFNGFTGTFTGSSLLGLSGTTLRLASGMTDTYTGITTLSTTSSGTITSNGKTFAGQINFSGSGGTWSLADDIAASGRLNFGAVGTFNSNNHNITASGVIASNSGMTALNMGTGTWTITGADAGGNETWKMPVGIVASTSTLVFNDATSTLKTLNMQGTFNAVTLTGAGSGTFLLSNSCTIPTLTVSTPPHTISIGSGKTITATTLAISGTAGNLNTLTGGTVSVASGTVSVNYMTIVSNTATGGATFLAGSNSTDGGGNSGWLFGAGGMLLVFF